MIPKISEFIVGGQDGNPDFHVSLFTPAAEDGEEEPIEVIMDRERLWAFAIGALEILKCTKEVKS